MPTKIEFWTTMFTRLLNFVDEAKEDISPQGLDVLTRLRNRSDLTYAALAGVLSANKAAVAERNFARIDDCLHAEGIADVQEILAVVHRRSDMHDKFWRYLDYLIEIWDS